MADRHDVAHRFANKLEGKNGRISAVNVRYEGRNYYSYSTVFGQWVDIKKNVCVIFDGSTSKSCSKHMLRKGLFPDDVHVFPLDFDGGSYSYWRNCKLVGRNISDEDFKDYHRMQMIDHYVERIYNQLAAINGGKKNGLENVDFSAWGYIEELCSLYKDTSINKYLKCTNNKDYKKLVKMLKSGTREVPYLVDQLFGRGTWMQYWDYCARFRKSADKRKKVEALCARLGIASPYESSWRGGCMDSGLTAAQIRNLTAKERLDLHFASIMRDERRKHEDERKEKYEKNKWNAYRWIVGCNPQEESHWYRKSYNDKVVTCRNMYTGDTYDLSGDYLYGFYWCNKSMEFDYVNFRNADNKEEWIRNFYADCEETMKNRKAIEILKRVHANTKEKQHSYDDNIYLNDEHLRTATTDEEFALCAWFIEKQDKHYADEEARRRAEEIARLKREEEERKEREYREQVKQEQIDECLSRGIEGKRDLWRKHLQGLYDIYDKDDEFYMGGNVLLRLNLKKDMVETSKNIHISVDTCKKMWKIVSKWHENPKCFKPMDINTKGSGRYTIRSYQNDILTAGCHKIAYTEMERMYNEIIANENNAA